LEAALSRYRKLKISNKKQQQQQQQQHDTENI
jgi:hypothetical protein